MHTCCCGSLHLRIQFVRLKWAYNEDVFNIIASSNTIGEDPLYRSKELVRAGAAVAERLYCPCKVLGHQQLGGLAKVRDVEILGCTGVMQ